MSNLNKFLTTLERDLPKVCADKDLVDSLPTVFKNSPTLTRMRARGETPPYFFIKPNFHYLREDVINWLKSRYQDTQKEHDNKKAVPQCIKKGSKKQ